MSAIIAFFVGLFLGGFVAVCSLALAAYAYQMGKDDAP